MLRGKERPTSTPGPTYMSNSQKAEYLRDLRAPNLARPSGSRPHPPSRFQSNRQPERFTNISTDQPIERPGLSTANSAPQITSKPSAHTRIESTDSLRHRHAGRPLARPPSTALETEEPSSIDPRPVGLKPSVSYTERGSRWMEKQEARSLRTALQDMDQDEERKVYGAAQDEAAELVWKHQNPDAPSSQPNAPYANLDLRRDYHSHLRKGSYQRSQGRDVDAVHERKVSGGSHESSEGTAFSSIKRRSMEALRKVSPPAGAIAIEKRRTPSGKSFGGLAEAVADDIAKAHRRSSSGSKRIFSAEKKRFMPDQIWEDPLEELSQQPQVSDPPKPEIAPQPSQIRKNPFARVRMQAEKLERSRSEPIVSTPMHHSVEIQKNTPSQSRRGYYLSNQVLPSTPPRPEGQPADEVAPKTTPTKDGREIRDDDIRAATSKKRSDYSPKLPRPTMVSDKPGRPIVSFQDQQPKEVVLEGVQAAPFLDAEADQTATRKPIPHTNPMPSTDSSSQSRPIPRIRIDEAGAPPIPTIVTSHEPTIPSIVLPEEPEFAEPFDAQSAPVTPAIYFQPPTFNIQSPEDSPDVATQASSQKMPFAQPWPTAGARPPLPSKAATSPISLSKGHCTPYVKPSGTLCGQCALPIAGRILSAGGERFHPSCFVCHQCHTNLELVAFYPEPEKARLERLSRIEARQSGAALPIDDLLQQEIDDGDDALRFFCHLDFHELFSPRCKSCKTPIEGEVIVACGAEWHAGHFFCAQCGDPFDSTTPFVEKDGYAWCVGCHTNRYSSKCRKCRKPVTETVVKALGHDWHESCFVCLECNGGFEDGRYFLRGAGQDPVCVKCEERRLKA